MIRHITKAIILLTIAAGLAGVSCAPHLLRPTGLSHSDSESCKRCGGETVKPDEPAETETVATEVAGEKSAEEESEEWRYIYIKGALIYCYGNINKTKILGVLTNGQKLTLLDKALEMVKIQLDDGTIGYVNEVFVADSKEELERLTQSGIEVKEFKERVISNLMAPYELQLLNDYRYIVMHDKDRNIVGAFNWGVRKAIALDKEMNVVKELTNVYERGGGYVKLRKFLVLPYFAKAVETASFHNIENNQFAELITKQIDDYLFKIDYINLYDKGLNLVNSIQLKSEVIIQEDGEIAETAFKALITKNNFIIPDMIRRKIIILDLNAGNEYEFPYEGGKLYLDISEDHKTLGILVTDFSGIEDKSKSYYIKSIDLNSKKVLFSKNITKDDPYYGVFYTSYKGKYTVLKRNLFDRNGNLYSLNQKQYLLDFSSDDKYMYYFSLDGRLGKYDMEEKKVVYEVVDKICSWETNKYGGFQLANRFYFKLFYDKYIIVADQVISSLIWYLTVYDNQFNVVFTKEFNRDSKTYISKSMLSIIEDTLHVYLSDGTYKIFPLKEE
jgi:hypothetical protein